MLAIAGKFIHLLGWSKLSVRLSAISEAITICSGAIFKGDTLFNDRSGNAINDLPERQISQFRSFIKYDVRTGIHAMAEKINFYDHPHHSTQSQCGSPEPKPPPEVALAVSDVKRKVQSSYFRHKYCQELINRHYTQTLNR